MEPPQHSQARRRRGSADQWSFEGDDPGDLPAGTDAGGRPDDHPGSSRFLGNDRQDARRRERRRERERQWERLRLVT